MNSRIAEVVSQLSQENVDFALFVQEGEERAVYSSQPDPVNQLLGFCHGARFCVDEMTDSEEELVFEVGGHIEMAHRQLHRYVLQRAVEEERRGDTEDEA